MCSQAAAQGNASSGVATSTPDVESAQALRALPGLETESYPRRLALAAQLRSMHEQFCTCFAGSPQPTPLKPFLLLGLLVALDHLEALGYDRPLAEAVANKVATRGLLRTARDFGVHTEPRVT